MVSAVDETGVTAIFLGLLRIFREREMIFSGMVAEKNKDCLFLGNNSKSFRIS